MKNETIEGMKLIALFMGEAVGSNGLLGIHQQNGDIEYEIPLDYNGSWDWLMPVVEKIESLGFRVEIIGLTCSIYTNSEENIYVDEPAMTKTEATWQAVVEFIKWYNSQTHNP